MMQTFKIGKYIAGFATILLFTLAGGCIGYGIGQFLNEKMLIMFAFAGTMSGLVVGAVYFVRKMYGQDLFVVEEPITHCDGELFDGDYVLTQENATNRIMWITRAEWEKIHAVAYEEDEGDDDDDDENEKAI